MEYLPNEQAILTYFERGSTSAWSSLDKGESRACQIAFQFNNKLGCF